MLTYLSKSCMHGTRLRCFLGPIASRSRVSEKIQYHRVITNTLNTKRVDLISRKTYCTRGNDKWTDRFLDLPPITHHTFSTDFISILPVIVIELKTYFNMCLPHDKDFNLIQFKNGCRQVISRISHAIVAEDYEFLQEVVPNDVLESLKERVNNLSANQKTYIATEIDEIYKILVYSLNVENKNHNGHEENIVDIELLGFYARNWRTDYNSLLELLQNTILCYYKFRRVYKDSHGGPWIITALNHFSFKYILK